MRTFKPYDPDQLYLLPPALRDWLPEGHVALDGTKIKANASKHKAMSYERMCKAEQELEQEVKRLLKQAEKVDEAEDQAYGEGKRGDELPEELARRESRLNKIRQAKAEVEEEARQQAEQAAVEAQAKIDERRLKEQQSGQKARGRRPAVVDPQQAVPEPKAQRNFTDADSRIMKDGATQGFVQGYNCQVVVDSQAQIIVAAALTQQANDKQQLVAMLEEVKKSTGEKPAKASADAGYFSEAQITDNKLQGIDL